MKPANLSTVKNESMNQTNENILKINIDAKTKPSFSVCNRLKKYHVQGNMCRTCFNSQIVKKVMFVKDERAMNLKNVSLYMLKVKQQVVLVSLKTAPLPNSLLFAAYMKLHFQFFQ